MHWSVFAMVPFMLALALGAMPRLGWRNCLTAIAAVAVIEILVIGNPGPHWETRHAIALWGLGIVAPWLVSGVFLFVVRTRNSRLLTSVGLVVVYFVALAVFLGIGDAMGLIPQ